MTVDIKTHNGHMRVELDKFFPTTVTRARKLFRLMQSGLEAQDKAAVREYIDKRGRDAAVVQRELNGHIEALEQQRMLVEAQVEELRMQLRTTRERITVAKSSVRKMESLEKNSSTWLREFDQIVEIDRRV